jgi:hypothetical protein
MTDNFVTQRMRVVWAISGLELLERARRQSLLSTLVVECELWFHVEAFERGALLAWDVAHAHDWSAAQFRELWLEIWPEGVGWFDLIAPMVEGTRLRHELIRSLDKTDTSSQEAKRVKRKKRNAR